MTLQEAMMDKGFAAPREIAWEGVIKRFPTDLDKPHSHDGWYIAFDDAKGKAAAFGSWRDGEVHRWSNGSGRVLTEAELQAIKANKDKALAEMTKNREQAALRAQRIYEMGKPKEVTPYLMRKGITCPEGVLSVDGVSSKLFGFEGNDRLMSGLLVPMRNRAGVMRSLQIIPHDPAYQKLFMRGGQVSGCFHVLGKLEGATRVVIAEGLATAQSVREALGVVAVVAFSAGNLPKAAEHIRALNATAEIIICADDDPAGIKGAELAAAVVQGRMVLPGNGINDFNDLHAAQGLAAVREAILGIEAVENDDWRADLIIHHKKDGTQAIPCRVHNLILILKNDQEFKGRFRFNEFSGKPAIDGQDMDDIGPIAIKALLEKQWIPEKVPTADVMDALQVVASHSTFHPVRDYLETLTWDGNERIPNFFEDFCGSVRDNYHIAVARSLFVSAVARIFKPGCKVDTMVILESPQGKGKSQLWLTLFGEWCSEVTASLNDKDFYSGMRGYWCLDFAELDAFSRAEATQIKRILTSQSDNYRPHYGRMSRAFPRQCVFVGGTNRDDWHTDATGARRFLPIKITEQIDITGVGYARDQLWAEAVIRFRQGETWWEIPDAEAHQESIYSGDPWEQPVIEYMDDIKNAVGAGMPGVSMETTTSDVLTMCLKIDKGRQTRSDEMRAGAILRRHGWVKVRRGGRNIYIPPP